MKRLAIVFGFSERCIPIAKQMLLSFDKNVLSEANQSLEVDVHAYQCNFSFSTPRIFPDGTSVYSPFTINYQFEDIVEHTPDLRFIMHKCSDEEFKPFGLPDIAVYQDFCDKYIHDYEYILFCHDDIAFFKKTLMLDQMMELLDGNRFNIITRVSFNCNEDISIRFHPEMIFIKSSAFVEAKLSFVNDYQIMDPKKYRLCHKGELDGGAQLLFSYYHVNNNTRGRPYSTTPESWYSHLRAYGDTGIEFSYIRQKDSLEFKQVIDSAKSYTDHIIYG